MVGEDTVEAVGARLLSAASNCGNASSCAIYAQFLADTGKDGDAEAWYRKSLAAVNGSSRAIAAKPSFSEVPRAPGHGSGRIGLSGTKHGAALQAADTAGSSSSGGSGTDAGRNGSISLAMYAGMLESRGKDGAARAEELYRRALALNPRCPMALGSYATFLHRIKHDLPAAEAAYAAATAAYPAHASVLCKYGGFLKHAVGRVDEAEVMFRRAIAANPTHAESLGSLAVLLHAAGRPNGGDNDNGSGSSDGNGDGSSDSTVARLYDRAVKSDPHNVNNLSNAGLFRAEVLKDLAGAEALYQRAMALDPQHANSVYNYAVLLDSGLKDRQRAEAMYRRCLAANPRHGYALYNLAVLLEERASRAAAAAAAARTAASAEAAANMVPSDKGPAEYAEAGNLFRRAVAACPKDALTLADYGRFLVTVEGKVKEGQRLLEAAVKADFTCATALFHLGKLTATHHGRLTEGKRLLERAVAAKPDHAAAHRCLAAVLAKQGTAGDEVAAAAAERHYDAAVAHDTENTDLLVEFADYLAGRAGMPPPLSGAPGAAGAVAAGRGRGADARASAAKMARLYDAALRLRPARLPEVRRRRDALVQTKAG